MINFLMYHGVYIALIMLQSYLEYKKGLDDKKENSYLEVLINVIRRKQK